MKTLKNWLAATGLLAILLIFITAHVGAGYLLYWIGRWMITWFSFPAVCMAILWLACIVAIMWAIYKLSILCASKIVDI